MANPVQPVTVSLAGGATARPAAIAAPAAASGTYVQAEATAVRTCLAAIIAALTARGITD